MRGEFRVPSYFSGAGTEASPTKKGFFSRNQKPETIQGSRPYEHPSNL